MIEPSREQWATYLDFWHSHGYEEFGFHYPVLRDRLLNWYFELLGSEKRLWWQRAPEAEDDRWPSCIRKAIMTLANESHLSPAVVANHLDLPEFPRGRQRVLTIAREVLRASS